MHCTTVFITYILYTCYFVTKTTFSKSMFTVCTVNWATYQGEYSHFGWLLHRDSLGVRSMCKKPSFIEQTSPALTVSYLKFNINFEKNIRNK